MNARRQFLGMAATSSVAAVATLAGMEHAANAQGSRPAARGLRRAAPRPFPRAVLTDQDGRPSRFYEDLVQDRVVVMNGAYASCPGICPLSIANLKRVHALMEGRVGVDFQMLTLSLQPAQDTPERLREYIARQRIPTRGWRFLTGHPIEVDAVRRRMGFYDLDPVIDADLNQHTGLITIGNDRFDWWCMTPALASPRLIVAAIDRMLRYD